MTSVAVNEAFVEISTVDDFRDFADQAGYDGVPDPEPEYQGAVQAGNALLDRATNSADEHAQLVDAVVDKPTVMGWDTVADNIVRNELADVVPPGAEHQQAARAHLVNQMAIPEWDGVQHRPGRGSMVAELTTEGIDRGVGQIREHYQSNPGEPYPAKLPNQAAAVSTEVQNGEQQRAVTNTVGTQLQSAGQTEAGGPLQAPPAGRRHPCDGRRRARRCHAIPAEPGAGCKGDAAAAGAGRRGPRSWGSGGSRSQPARRRPWRDPDSWGTGVAGHASQPAPQTRSWPWGLAVPRVRGLPVGQVCRVTRYS
jgi:hypothetical protein